MKTSKSCWIDLLTYWSIPAPVTPTINNKRKTTIIMLALLETNLLLAMFFIPNLSAPFGVLTNRIDKSLEIPLSKMGINKTIEMNKKGPKQEPIVVYLVY